MDDSDRHFTAAYICKHQFMFKIFTNYNFLFAVIDVSKIAVALYFVCFQRLLLEIKDSPTLYCLTLFTVESNLAELMTKIRPEHIEMINM